MMINSALSKFLLVLLFLGFAICLNSCGQEQRKAPPIINIVVLDDWDAYLLDGQRLNGDTLETRLQRQADLYRREITGTSRAFVRISAKAEGATSYREKQRLMKYCMKIGLDKVQIH